MMMEIRTINQVIPAAANIIILFYCITVFINTPSWGQIFGLADKYARRFNWCVNDIIQGIRIILFGFAFLTGVKIEKWNRTYALLLLLLCLNIFTVFSDYLYGDIYDKAFLYPKLIIAIYLFLDTFGFWELFVYPLLTYLTTNLATSIKKIKK